MLLLSCSHPELAVRHVAPLHSAEAALNSFRSLLTIGALALPFAGCGCAVSEFHVSHARFTFSVFETFASITSPPEMHSSTPKTSGASAEPLISSCPPTMGDTTLHTASTASTAPLKTPGRSRIVRLKSSVFAAARKNDAPNDAHPRPNMGTRGA